MKKLLLIFAFSFVGLVLHAQELAMFSNAKGAEFTWKENQAFDLGKVAKDQPATHVFSFTNTGSEPLVISSARASCGCTVASYTQEPIPAGQAGEIVVTYNAKKPGLFQKSVTVISNATESPVTLYLKGEVVEK